MRNYLIGFTELGMDTTEMEDHFASQLGVEVAGRLLAQMRRELGLAQVAQLSRIAAPAMRSAS